MITKRSPLFPAAVAFLGLALHVSAGEWITLFDGENLDAWKGYQQEGIPEGWSIQDGILTTTGKGRADLITKEEFEDFELVVEWKIEKSGNSGIFIRADEEPEKIWHHAPEIQIFDAKKDDSNLRHQAGAIYALFPTEKEAIKPAGEWNETRVKVKDGVITVVQNGVETASVKVGGKEWNEKVSNSKFSKFEKFGRNEKGHIGLQDHGQPAWFRSVKVKKLP